MSFIKFTILGLSCLSLVNAASGATVTGTEINIGSGNIYTSGNDNSIGGGHLNTNQALNANISGGIQNYIGYNWQWPTIGGGAGHVIKANRGTIGGGELNIIAVTNNWRGSTINTNANYSENGTIAGGSRNEIYAIDSTIGGGILNLIAPIANYSTVSGGSGNVIALNSGYSVIAGGTGNMITNGGWWGSIGGGEQNMICGPTDAQTAGHYGWIGGGYENIITNGGSFASIGGGGENLVEGYIGTVAGGYDNLVSGDYGTIGGGYLNTVGLLGQHSFVNFSTIAGGWKNMIKSPSGSLTANYSVIGGGVNNTNTADCATITGGQNNTAEASFTQVGGYYAKASHMGAFVWADSSSSTPFASTANNQFAVRATGGARILTGTGMGVQLAAGAGSWTSISDKNLKENFQAVRPRDILGQVVSLPVSNWNYKSQEQNIRHIGPMAQDFRAAFGLGEDDKTISPIDTSGVAFAAIQGLNQIVAEKEERLNSQEKVNNDQAARIRDLELRLSLLEKKIQ